MNIQTAISDTPSTVYERSISPEAKNLISAASEKIVKDMDYLLKGYNISEIQGTISRSISSIIRGYVEDPTVGKQESPIKLLTERKVPYHTQSLVQEVAEEIITSIKSFQTNSTSEHAISIISQSIISLLRGYIEEKNG